MKIYNFSIKQLTVIVSLILAMTFVVCYLCFRYFWTYDVAIEKALVQQNEETQRVETLIALQQNELAKTITDYAAWDEVVDFINGNNDELLEESINEHAFVAMQINGFFIFDANVGLVWGRLYDYIHHQALSYDEMRDKFDVMLADTLRTPSNSIKPSVTFLVLNKEPHLLATSRVCNSDGEDCNKGFMMIIKPVGQDFSHTLKQATGLDVAIKTKSSRQVAPNSYQQNVTVIERIDYQNDSTVFVEIHHTVKLPDFITWEELSAVFAFALFMFIFNLGIAHILIRPIKRARNALDQLMKGETSQLTEQDMFISYEMRDFVTRINEVFAQLESKQRELEWVSLHDALTKVGNRRSLQQYWDSLLESEMSQYISVLLLDIDYFKLFNDHYGHIEGDEALQRVASALKQSPTQCTKFVARFGGEEFCVVLSSGSLIDNQQEAEWLRLSIEELAINHEYSPISSNVTLSVGVADCGTEPPNDLQNMFLAADRALYQAKNNGRNQYVIFRYPI